MGPGHSPSSQRQMQSGQGQVRRRSSSSRGWTQSGWGRRRSSWGRSWRQGDRRRSGQGGGSGGTDTRYRVSIGVGYF
jgi:hypothetical protein